MPSSYTWPLTLPPEPISPADEAESAASRLAAGVVRRPKRGLLSPFRRDGASDFAAGTGGALIRSAVEQILGTRCDSPSGRGELPWRTEFGSRLHLCRHQNNNAVLEALARQYVIDSLARWLSSVRVLDVRVSTLKDSSGHETILLLVVVYEVVSRGGDVLGRDSTSVPLGRLGRS